MLKQPPVSEFKHINKLHLVQKHGINGGYMKAEVSNIYRVKGITEEQIKNMDQTGMYYNKLTNRMPARKQKAKNIKRKKMISKGRVKIMVCTTAS